MKTILVGFFGLFILMYYISLVTGFFVLYYYDKKLHKNIVIIGDDSLDYFKHIIHLAIFILLTMLIIIKKTIIGIFLFGIFLITGIILRIFIKKNMKNVIKIYTGTIRSLGSIYFRNKTTTILLSPFSNGIILAMILIMCIGIIFWIRT